jgi:hypothetical protein
MKMYVVTTNFRNYESLFTTKNKTKNKETSQYICGTGILVTYLSLCCTGSLRGPLGPLGKNIS